MLFHPRILARSCDDCQRWLFDDDHQKILRVGIPVRRPAGSPTPCWKCPKQNPRQGRPLERDLPRIGRAVELYFRIRGTAGSCLSAAERRDPLLARGMALVDALLRRAELEQTARTVSIFLTKTTRGGA